MKILHILTILSISITALAVEAQLVDPKQPCGTTTRAVDPPANTPGGATEGSGTCMGSSGDATSAAEGAMLDSLFGECATCPPFPNEDKCTSFANYGGGSPTFGSAPCGSGIYKPTWSVPAGVTITRACTGC